MSGDVRRCPETRPRVIDARLAWRQGVAEVRQILTAQILPHFEEAGWRLTQPLLSAWAAAVRPRLRGFWSDVSCPMEGHSRYGTPTSVIYNELEGLTSLLRYDSVPIGCCGIVLHPKWQRRAYPVTFFTTAPYDVLQAAILGAEAERAAQAPAPMES